MDGRNPHLFISRCACAIIALGCVHGRAWGHARDRLADLESRIVVLEPTDAPVAAGGSWLFMVVVVALGVLAWALWRGGSRSKRAAMGAGIFSKLFPKRISTHSARGGAIEILDRAALARGQSLTLIRVGDRVVLLGQSSQGIQRLAEFSADSPDAPRAIDDQTGSALSSVESHRRVG